ncbi:MAG: glycosyltransferase family 4 protein [Streptosporangiaceae bacterium]
MTSADEAIRLTSAAWPAASEDRPLTVAMVTRLPPTESGGVERVVAGLLKELERIRPSWQVDIVCAFPNHSRIAGVAGLADVIASLRLGWLLRRSTADVIFVHCPECVWGIRLLRRRRATPPLVAVWHGAGAEPHLRLRRPGHPLAWALAWIRMAGAKKALRLDGHIAVHPRVAADLRSLYGLRDGVTVIENAVDTTIFDHVSRAADGPGRDGLNVLWVGRSGYLKGLDVALAAVAEARRDLPGLRLTVAGVAHGKATEGVHWLGVLPPTKMAEVYGAADLLIFPSRYDGFGLATIEAMAAGLPVIVSDVIASGIVTDGRNGAVIPGHDPSRYAAALRRLADPAVRAAMAAANREDVRRFNAESAGADYVAVAESFAASQ